MLGALVAVPLLLTLLLSIGRVQNFVAHKASDALSEKLETDVGIGSVRYVLFNKFSFRELHVNDLNGETLLAAEKGTANFHFWKIFKKQLLIDDISLNGVDARLAIDKEGVSNLNFIVEAFRKPKKDKKSDPLDFRIGELTLKNSSFKFDNYRREAIADSSRFDGSHFHFKNISGKFTLHHLQGDSLAVTIHQLSTVEKSGFTVDGLQTYVTGLRDGFRMPSLSVQMPGSEVRLDSVKMEYDSIADVKDVLNLVHWNAEIKPSKVTLADLACFYPNFANLTDPVDVSGELRGRISSFQAKNLDLGYHNTFLLKANVDMNGLPEIEDTFIYCDVEDLQVNRAELQDFVAKITNKPFVLPQELSRLGNVKYQGNITGFFSNLVSYGSLVTDVGSLRTDILVHFENKMKDFRYSGTVKSGNFQLGRLLANNTFGKAAFKISTNGTKLYKKPLQGHVSGTLDEFFLNKYSYRNIRVDGDYDGNGFEGDMQINDPNLTAWFSGVVDLTGQLPFLNFDLAVDSADINALKLVDLYPDSRLSFRANTNLLGNSLDNINGFLLFDSIRFVNREKELALELLLLESEMQNGSSFTITSDLLNAEFSGDFKYSTLPASFTNMLQVYLPAISGSKVAARAKAPAAGNVINFDININNIEELADVLELPFAVDNDTHLSGLFDDKSELIVLNTEIPALKIRNSKFEDLIFSFDNLGEQLNLDLYSVFLMPSDKIGFNFKSSANRDSIMSNLAWNNNDTTLFAGELQARTIFSKEDDKMVASIAMLPTQIALADATWTVMPSVIDFKPDHIIDIRQFAIRSEDQYIWVDGVASKDINDVVNAQLENVDVGYILDLVRLKAVSLSGKTTGQITISSLLHKPIFESSLFVQGAMLNNSPMGDAVIYTGWSSGDSELLVSGTFTEGENVTLANGSYSFEEESLNFVFDANRLNIGFLERWLGAVAQDIQGRASGTLRMSGPVKNIGFEGNIYAEDASMSIEFLQTRYSFTDSIHMKRDGIELKNITVFDSEKNRGTLNGRFSHDGSFQNFDYDLRIRANNMLALNTTVQDNDLFYGKAYATGDVRISGTDEVVNIDVNVTSQPKTKVFISAGSASVANENDFITFVSVADTLTSEKPVTQAAESGAQLNLAMNLNVTPDAEIQLIISPQDGDMISGTGEGSLRLLLNDDDFRMYGGYTIERGSYLFTLENFLRKQFRIEEGSTVSWSGDPMRAQLDIKAVHSVTASLYDLMSEDILRTTGRTSVPVNAVLFITDEMLHPDIRFDVELPSSDETLKMQVKNLINTEEMMNRQMVYLLLFGRFYTPDYNRNAGGPAAGSFSNFSSLASSAAFGQLSNYLSQLVENVTVGLNIRNTGYEGSESQEYETAINFQPNNRLIVNGNFGYRDDNYAKNKIIGDVDIEYLFSEKSKWRLKAFNHTMDRYSMKSAPFVQGVGIMYKQDFNTWGDLFERYKRVRKTDEESEEIPVQTAVKAEQQLIVPDSIARAVSDSLISKNDLAKEQN